MLGLAAVLILHCRPTGSNPFHPSRRPLAAILPLFLRPVQLPIPLGLNLLLMPGEHVLWSDVADGTVQANVRTSPYYPQSNGKIERWHKSLKSECIRPGTPLSLEDARRLVEGYVEHYNNVRHAREPNKLLEVLRDKLRPVVRDYSRLDPGIPLLGPFQNDLNVGLGHRFPQIPMNQETAVAIQDAAKVVERRANIQVGNIDMPVLVRLRRLFKPGPFLRRLPAPLPHQSRPTQHPPYASRTHGHDVVVQHHERQSPIAFQRILQVERNDRLLLPIVQPKVPGNPAVMLIHLAVPLAPAVELAGCNVEPPDETPRADLGLPRPAPDEIHDLVPRIVRNPGPGQSSQLFFLGQHALPSVQPKPHLSSGSSAPDKRFVPVQADGWCVSFVEKLPLHSRKTPSASGRTRLAGVPVRHTDPRSALLQPNAASE